MIVWKRNISASKHNIIMWKQNVIKCECHRYYCVVSIKVAIEHSIIVCEHNSKCGNTCSHVLAFQKIISFAIKIAFLSFLLKNRENDSCKCQTSVESGTYMFNICNLFFPKLNTKNAWLNGSSNDLKL